MSVPRPSVYMSNFTYRCITRIVRHGDDQLRSCSEGAGLVLWRLKGCPALLPEVPWHNLQSIPPMNEGKLPGLGGSVSRNLLRQHIWFEVSFPEYDFLPQTLRD